MQANYALCRDIMRACQDARPTAVNIAGLCGKFPDRTAQDIRCHAHVLEAEGFVETRKLRSPAAARPLGYPNKSAPHTPLAANRILGKPDGQVNWR